MRTLGSRGGRCGDCPASAVRAICDCTDAGVGRCRMRDSAERYRVPCRQVGSLGHLVDEPGGRAPGQPAGGVTAPGPQLRQAVSAMVDGTARACGTEHRPLGTTKPPRRQSTSDRKACRRPARGSATPQTARLPLACTAPGQWTAVTQGNEVAVDYLTISGSPC
jgi:hypothetical protein